MSRSCLGAGDLYELREDHKEQRGNADDDGGLGVESVDLVADARGEAGVLDALQASAIDVPDAALPDVSQTRLSGREETIREEERRRDRHARQCWHLAGDEPHAKSRRQHGQHGTR